MPEKVNRDLKLTDPPTEGPDVEALQRNLNGIAEQFEAIVRFHLKEDGALGERTLHATYRAAYVVGLSQGRLAEIEESRLIAQPVQLKIRRPEERDGEEKERSRRRREDLRKKLEDDDPDFNGQPTNVAKVIDEVVLVANQMGLFVTSTTSGGHTSTSHHFPANNADGLGHAVDVAAAMDQMIAFQKEAVKRWPQALEIFGPANSPWVKNGQVFTEAEGTALENLHDNHVHVAR